MKPKHTPGPWYATQDHVQSAVLNEDNYICRVEGQNEQEIEANAALIAAAPELLEFAVATLAILQGEYDNPALIKWGMISHDRQKNIIREAISIISKATQ